MVELQAGDILIREITESGFLVLDGSTLAVVAEPFQFFAASTGTGACGSGRFQRAV